MNKPRSAKIALYVSLIFLAGVVTGVLVGPWIGRPFLRPPNSAQMSRHMLHRLESGLHLTNEQVNQVGPLIEKTGREMEAIRRETTRHVLERMSATNTQISALLTPEQRIAFTKMEAEQSKRLRQRHPFAEPPGPPPPPVPADAR